MKMCGSSGETRQRLLPRLFWAWGQVESEVTKEGSLFMRQTNFVNFTLLST
jgi:hypothetical protein